MKRGHLALIGLMTWILAGCSPSPPLPPPPPKAKQVCTERPICVTNNYGQTVCKPRCIMVYEKQ